MLDARGAPGRRAARGGADRRRAIDAHGTPLTDETRRARARRARRAARRGRRAEVGHAAGRHAARSAASCASARSSACSRTCARRRCFPALVDARRCAARWSRASTCSWCASSRAGSTSASRAAGRSSTASARRATPMVYDEVEIARIARVAFDARAPAPQEARDARAQGERARGVAALGAGRGGGRAASYPDVSSRTSSSTRCAMLLLREPRRYDVRRAPRTCSATSSPTRPR